MNRGRRAFALGTAVLALGMAASLYGCSGEAKLTPKEQSMIKGTGQMPPEAREMMAKKMAEARAKMQQQRGGPGNAGK